MKNRAEFQSPMEWANMKMRFWVFVLATTMALVACGGGAGKTDAQIPTVTSLSAQIITGFGGIWTATATDNVAVTGYCFKVESRTPLPTDGCFHDIEKSFFQAQYPVVYVWAKDAIGNVSATYRDAVSPTIIALTSLPAADATVTLTATATDNVAVTEYCFKSENSTPSPTDVCFQTSAQKSGVNLTTNPTNYVWAMDAVGNVSAAFAFTDTAAPTIASLTVQSMAGTVATLLATVTDNVAATGYCFKTEITTPLASDACFQASAQKAGVDLATTPATYVWARDLAGNVSAALAGPCSTVGYAASAASAKNTVCMMTDKGAVVLELDGQHAPGTVSNFLAYANTGFYTGTAFHRVISSFMIQGGGMTYANGTYSEKATLAPIALERTTVTGLSNTRGTIAMARTSAADSATSQFFINVVDNLFLDGSASQDGYAVFGQVIAGMDVVDLIKKVPVHVVGVASAQNPASEPDTPLFIQWAYQLK
jgi:cyclophilin family peptidyl-prolyl cis-trans isomerase